MISVYLLKPTAMVARPAFNVNEEEEDHTGRLMKNAVTMKVPGLYLATVFSLLGFI